MLEASLEIILLLTLAAFFAGFMDAIAGGGGLVTIPALLLAGFPPVLALGTNKLQGMFGSAMATFTYARAGHVNVRGQLLPGFLSFLASIAGALAATIMPTDLLSGMLPILLIAVALYFSFKPNLNDLDRARRITPFVFGFTIVPLLGFYDGAFGPGTGSFFMLAFVGLAGQGMLKATAHTKFLNFASNVGGFAAFAAVGAIAWKIGLIMGVAQIAGARIGAAFAMKKGARIIKPLLVLACLALAARLLMEGNNPLLRYIGL
ncbi:TSUP family transporter [Nitratireductor kimnyeongensis]|uniref:Probable membrane transporter protein n=1 Tax=Nitratireductor kimnyeongensis TaxID=430679 RepID=A0ABW0T3X1_9HYPH|nr:TSUP family transporter [Nitratireductor kimnyeongensis]QZZ37492.1 TSUP family transporter [Nitratireductor kimnyeongensis]